jgi:2-haloacid dehalogenase
MMAARKLDKSVSEGGTEDLRELLKHLPVKEGVQEGLSSLHALDFRIAALTNAPENTVRLRMERTGLVSYVKAVLSAEHIKKYKPCCEVTSGQQRNLELILIKYY